MFQGIVCYAKSKVGDCSYYNDKRIEEEIRVAELCIKNIAEFEKRLDQCVTRNNINEVLKFKGEFIDKFYWYEVLDKERTERIEKELYSKAFLIDNRKSCKLSYKVCKKLYERKIIISEQSLKIIDEAIKKYNAELSIIKKVQNYCIKQADHKDHASKNVYFKFGRDKYNDLIALYFNIEHFLRKEYSPVETIFVFSGEGEYAYDKHTMLHLKYENCHWSLHGAEINRSDRVGVSHAHICDFISNNPRRGHGTFILKNLEDIIRRVNSRFLELKKLNEDDFYDKTTLRAIDGEVVPGSIISRDDLVRLYNKNGLLTVGKTYEKSGYLRDRIIYKKLS